jgi:glucose/arabinose dehydrogenase
VGQALTISLWFKADSFTVSDARLISKATGTSESQHYWMLSTIDSGGPKLRFRLRTGSTTSTLIASSGDLLPGVWTHAVAVYDGTTMRIYKDGVEVGSMPKTGVLASNPGVLAAIGNQPAGAGSRPFRGSIDDVRIYDRALTGPEIVALSTGTNAPPESSIDAPTGPLTITAGESVVFAGSGTDPDGDLPLTYSWDFGDPTILPSSARDPGSVVFSQAGTFDVLFAVTDSAGATDPTPASVRIVVEAATGPPPDGSISYIGGSAVWRYFDAIRFPSTAYPSPDAQGDAWNEADFDDSAWPTGSGLFGYGDLNGFSPTTLLSHVNVTNLFRTTFDVVDPPNDLMAYVLRDDAFVLYLNGVEVARDNISDPVDANTFADSTVDGADESALLSIALDPAALVVGTNTLAVEVHNYPDSNLDLGFGLLLEGNSSGNGSFVPASVTVDVELVATGFDAPVYLTSPTGDPRLFVLEAGGRIFIVENGNVLATPFLDLSSDVSGAPDGGLLGLAFDPDYDQNGLFYVHRTAFSGDSVLSRFSVSSDPDVANAGSEQVLLQLPQPFDGQNGGAIAFGPDDGFLYVGLGDGGSTGDPGNRAQDGDSLLGKLLRLDVGVPPAPDSIPNGAYAIPADNPFVGDPGVRDEIWALGLRDPYRFSFDPELWDLWLADEGQDSREEVNFEPWGSAGGNNYGWDVMEGAICNDDDPAPTPPCGDISLVPPLHDYPHTNGNCAITGGYVYRGGAQDLVGEYFFADFCSGGVWSLDALTGDGTNWTQALGEAAGKPSQLVSFGEGGDGDLYVLHLNGDIYRISAGGPVCNEEFDSDCDGIPDDGAPGDLPCATGQFEGCDDNCPFAPNPGQEDTAGLGVGSAPDGIGDECQCGDVNGDGAVSSEDGAIILGALLVPPSAVMNRPDLCDVGDSIGCSSADGVIVTRSQVWPYLVKVQQQCEPANPL